MSVIFDVLPFLLQKKIQRGVLSVRSDDMKSMKGPMLDWIIPHGQSLHLPLTCNIKTDQGFHHDLTGALLCPAGMDWANPECAYAFPISVPADADSTCRIKVQLQSGEIIVSGDQWPVFIYTGCKFNPEDPWKGMFRSAILVSISEFPLIIMTFFSEWIFLGCTSMYSITQFSQQGT
jgi:hypothetical protein